MHEAHLQKLSKVVEFRGSNSAKNALRHVPALNLSRSKYISIPMRFAKPHLRLPIPKYYFGAEYIPTVPVQRRTITANDIILRLYCSEEAETTCHELQVSILCRPLKHKKNTVNTYVAGHKAESISQRTVPESTLPFRLISATRRSAVD